MRYFHWKTAIVSVIIFLFPIFFYPVSGTISNGITTYSYGFPSPWLTLQFQDPGGKLFGFQLFGLDVVGCRVSILTAVLDLLIIYLVLISFVRVFWINHFSIKFAAWKEKRYDEKYGSVPEQEAADNEIVGIEYIVASVDDDHNNCSLIATNENSITGEEKQINQRDACEKDILEGIETNKTA